MGQKGQSLVELSVTLVIILLLLSGLVEFGIVFFQFVQIRDAAQEGALYGSYCQNDSQITERIIGASNSPIDLNDTHIFIQYVDEFTGLSKDKSLLKDGDGVYVQVSYVHKVFMPFLPVLLGDALIINGDVTDTILKVDC